MQHIFLAFDYRVIIFQICPERRRSQIKSSFNGFSFFYSGFLSIPAGGRAFIYRHENKFWPAEPLFMRLSIEK